MIVLAIKIRSQYSIFPNFCFELSLYYFLSPYLSKNRIFQFFKMFGKFHPMKIEEDYDFLYLHCNVTPEKQI